MEHDHTAQSVIAGNAAAAVAAVEGALPPRPKIGAEELRKANMILKRYKEGKTRHMRNLLNDTSRIHSYKHPPQNHSGGILIDLLHDGKKEECRN